MIRVVLMLLVVSVQTLFAADPGSKREKAMAEELSFEKSSVDLKQQIAEGMKFPRMEAAESGVSVDVRFTLSEEKEIKVIETSNADPELKAHIIDKIQHMQL